MNKFINMRNIFWLSDWFVNTSCVTHLNVEQVLKAVFVGSGEKDSNSTKLETEINSHKNTKLLTNKSLQLWVRVHIPAHILLRLQLTRVDWMFEIFVFVGVPRGDWKHFNQLDVSRCPQILSGCSPDTLRMARYCSDDPISFRYIALFVTSGHLNTHLTSFSEIYFTTQHKILSTKHISP